MLMRGLPLELLLSVVSYVDETADLASLCVTSKLFFSIAQASLYKTISVGGGNLQGLQYGMKKLALDDHFNLYRTLQSTNNIYTFVTDFRVHFQPCSRGKERLGVPCRCDDFDTMLGQALIRLENIRTLGFRCICCKSRDWKASRHQYLNELQCKQLDQLIFRCSCYAFDARYKNTSIFFDKPFMSTVQSLSLSSVPLGVASVLARDGCLPALKKLSCNDQNSVEKLLAKGILTHLMAEFIFDRDLASILSQIPPSLQHLVIGDVLDQLNLYGALNSHSYPNIRHLGIFSLNTVSIPPLSAMDLMLTRRSFNKMSLPECERSYHAFQIFIQSRFKCLKVGDAMMRTNSSNYSAIQDFFARSTSPV